MFDRLSRSWLRFKAYMHFKRRIEVFGPYTVIHPCRVSFGDHCAINHGVFILGANSIEIGDYVVLSANVMLIDTGLDPGSFDHVVNRRYRNEPIRIGAGAWIGAGAIVLGGVTIGELAVVGAGSVVTRDVGAGAVVAGNPARPISSSGAVNP